MEVCQSIYHSRSPANGGEENSPREVGHNIYILAYQLAHLRPELKSALEKADKASEAISEYRHRTAQIEVSVAFVLPSASEDCTRPPSIGLWPRHIGVGSNLAL